MILIPEEYCRLIRLGITKKANLSDLNDMTDRGKFPMKPFTAEKTIGVMGLIRKYNIQDEETLVDQFQKNSKKDLVQLTEEVYEYQKKYFKKYKYDKGVIFKYVYCCVVINSLKGNSNEKKFDSWAKTKSLQVKHPPSILDQKFHVDRFQYDRENRITSFISIKPNSFSINYIRYGDVFGGLAYLSELSGKPWRIYFRDN